jgi:hypothetical protein
MTLKVVAGRVTVKSAGRGWLGTAAAEPPFDKIASEATLRSTTT